MMDIIPTPLEVISSTEDALQRNYYKLILFLSEDPMIVNLRNQVSIILGEGSLGIYVSNTQKNSTNP